MKKFFLFFLGVFSASVVLAHPPSKVKLDYDIKNSSLKVSVSHVTQDFYDHYIRKVILYKNSAEVQTVFNHKQVNPNSIDFLFSVEAKEGDELAVDIFCSEGGTKKASVVVPKEEEQVKDSE